MTRISTVIVVVPARDEEELVERNLRSVVSSIERMQRAVGHRSLAAEVVLVADACNDDTARIARGVESVRVLEAPFGRVGAARAAGIRSALASEGVDPATTWIANTDADSVVPSNWLTRQLGWAHAGYELIVGTVRPDFADLTPAQIAAWHDSHDDGRALGHVHGANLGVLASTYLAVGGFADLAEHEDVELVERISLRGARVLATDRIEVMTSGRLRGRTPGGYAEHLATTLAREAALASARP